MISGNAILVVDLGNSSTKCAVLFGKDAKTGRFRKREFDIPNVFAPIEEGYEVSADYSDETSTILRVDTTLNGEMISGCFCNGELQEKEKPLSTIKPSASAKKYDLDSTVLSYRLAFLFACKGILSLQRATDYTQLDITWKVVTLLPPGDIETGAAKLKELINNIDKVEALYPAVNIPIKIASVTVMPEGFCAYAGAVYEEGATFRTGYDFLTEETVLVFDIGAGTTDCLLIKENKLVQNSKYTITQGGNNVHQLVRRSLRMKGLDIDDNTIRNGIVTGKVRDGSKDVDIIDIINSAKADVAQKIVSEIQDFLDLTDIKARSVGYVLVCGGGSMQDSEVAEIIPLSKRVIESFKKLSPNAELVEIPTRTVALTDEDGGVTRVEQQISPRYLNLVGATILAEAV